VAWVAGAPPGGGAFKAASLFVFQFALNLLPILELDGYIALTDLIDAPLLRQRSIAFARSGVMRKIRRRDRWSPSELGLALYGVSAIVTSVLMIATSLGLWQTRVAVA